MDAMFGVKITNTQVCEGVTPHVIIPLDGLSLEDKDALLASLPIQTGHFIMADRSFSFLIALISLEQKKMIQLNRNVKYVGEVNVDDETLALLLKDGMQILSN